MTPHELARRLLELPDLPVIYDRGTGYAEWEPCVIDTVEPITLYQVDFGQGWDPDLADHVPHNPRLPVREVQAVKVS